MKKGPNAPVAASSFAIDREIENPVAELPTDGQLATLRALADEIAITR